MVVRCTQGPSRWRLLLELTRRTSAEWRLVFRAKIIICRVYERRSVSETALLCETSRRTVRKWERRYRKRRELDSLRDAPRSGRPPRITLRDHGVVLSLACQKPEALGRLETRMTQALIVEEAEKQNARLSRSSVQRILAAAEVKPHRNRYYLFTKKQDPEYERRRDAICDLYMRELPDDEVVVCFDEKTGMQALGRPHEGKGTQPGMPQLTEHNYIRYGSRSLAAAVRVDTGELVAAKLFPPRGYATPQAIEMLRRIAVALSSYRVIHLVWDNASTHCSKAMHEFLASTEGRRFRVYYTPTHASWLNLCENFFSRFSRRYHNGRRYQSLDDFIQHIEACFVAYDAIAKPVAWTYNPAKRAA